MGNSKQNQWQVTRSADSDFDLTRARRWLGEWVYAIVYYTQERHPRENFENEATWRGNWETIDKIKQIPVSLPNKPGRKRVFLNWYFDLNFNERKLMTVFLCCCEWRQWWLRHSNFDKAAELFTKSNPWLQREARYRFHQIKIFREFLENSFYGCSRTSR